MLVFSVYPEFVVVGKCLAAYDLINNIALATLKKMSTYN